MMKKAIAILALATIIGCSSIDSKKDLEQTVSQSEVVQSAFNEEVYVWESFNFPTNRTSGLQ